MHDARDFSDAYFTSLISDTNSKLYEELKDDYNGTSSGDNRFPEYNRILKFLFEDACVAEQLGVWRPIGEHILKLMRSDEPPDRDLFASLNKRVENFNQERWTNPISTGIYFFDVMVTAAAEQGVCWHMWLYYFPHFIERLEKLYDTSDPAVNPSDEFPTRSSRLIYEIFCVLRNWIRLAQTLPTDSPHLTSSVFAKSEDRLVYQGGFSDNGNIPVSAANALGMCMRDIVLSERIGEQFKSYMYSIVVDTIHELRVDHWRSLLIRCIVHGGPMPLSDQYGQSLSKLNPRIDHVVWDDVSDFKEALEQTYPNI